MTIGWEIKKVRIASRLQSSLRDLLISYLYPALKRWATGERSSGAKIRARVAMLVVHSIHKCPQVAQGCRALVRMPFKAHGQCDLRGVLRFAQDDNRMGDKKGANCFAPAIVPTGLADFLPLLRAEALGYWRTLLRS